MPGARRKAPGSGGDAADPIAMLAAEHDRQRRVYDAMDRLALPGDPARTDLELVGMFLERDFARHMEWEETWLFPLMKRRCRPEDAMDETLDLLVKDHRRAARKMPALRRAVDGCLAERRPLAAAERAALADFAARERRHLIVENAIVLPLARARLTKRDLAAPREESPDAE